MDWDGNVSLKHYFNDDSHNSSLISFTNQTIGFSNIVTSYINGVAKCSFTRVNLIYNLTNHFELNDNQYYILTASGPLGSSGLSSSILDYMIFI